MQLSTTFLHFIAFKTINMQLIILILILIHVIIIHLS
jgi:hypothetical protein